MQITGNGIMIGINALVMTFNHDDEIAQEFEKNKDLFQIAYSAGNQYLISHAGVSMIWYYRNKVLAGQDKINRFFNS